MALTLKVLKAAASVERNFCAELTLLTVAFCALAVDSADANSGPIVLPSSGVVQLVDAEFDGGNLMSPT